jgi:hypothetical protein
MNRPAPKTVRRRFFVALGHAIHVTWPVLSTILAIQVALGLLIGFVEGWSVGDAVYFTFVTGLTIGYGDIVPRQALARPAFIYHISLNGYRGDWYWEVSCGGYIGARGLAATQAQARTDAMRAALSHVDPRPENLPFYFEDPLPPLPHFGAA